MATIVLVFLHCLTLKMTTLVKVILDCLTLKIMTQAPVSLYCLILKMTPVPVFLDHRLCRWNYYVPPKRRELFNSRHDIISMNAQTFSSYLLRLSRNSPAFLWNKKLIRCYIYRVFPYFPYLNQKHTPIKIQWNRSYNTLGTNSDMFRDQGAIFRENNKGSCVQHVLTCITKIKN
jgi:hypothetical protein